MRPGIRWTNPSIKKLAGDQDPIDVMESRVREAVLTARDEGWSGPPFDPVELARILGLAIEARSDIPDARTVASGDKLRIEFNPLRPRARVRFSVAHEIAHSLFPDCADAVRHRGGSPDSGGDNWQLEVLCNIAAAELLMPAGSFVELGQSVLSIDKVLSLRRQFDVSTEAMLIRVAKLANEACAAFCASRHGDRYKLDYFIPSVAWRTDICAGMDLPGDSKIADANAIGFTAIGEEEWISHQRLKFECVALSPYPGAIVPRVVGIVRPAVGTDTDVPQISEVTGDCLQPRGQGRKIIAHVVPDSSAAWGGGGFAAQMRKKHPGVWEDFRGKARQHGLPLALGTVFESQRDTDSYIVHMVAQRGIGPSDRSRIRYGALERCLMAVASRACELGATVHMPKIGTGHAGGDWQLIRELIYDHVVRMGIPVTIYSLPARS